jgi:DNA-binding HxlR family transcriptional regulator/putative sterol carrier protein
VRRTEPSVLTYNWGVKGYHQYCPVANALDQVGDRWELLIVRELMLGQRRYTDLAEALPGIGSNILTTRLRELEAAGIVRKTKLPPPFAVSVYELTDYGRELDVVLRALAQWGARTLGAPAPEDCWSMYAVHVRFRPESAVDGTYEIRFVGGETISLQVTDGALVAMKLSAEDPTLVVEAAPEDLHAVIGGDVDAAAAVTAGRVRLLVGTEKELADLVAMFAPAEDVSAAAAA